jgi:hypothetical protein
VAAYLDARQIAWTYEPDVGGKHPDFLAKWRDVDVVLEVYEPQITLPRFAPGNTAPPDLVGSTGGWIDSQGAIRAAFNRRKRQQIKAVSDSGLPYVAVVAETRAEMGVQPLMAAGAMFGNITVRLQVGPGAPEHPDATMGFGSGAELQPGRRTGVSAMAIPKAFNPTMWQAERLVTARLTEAGFAPSAPSTHEQLISQTAVIRDAYAEATESGVFDPEAVAVRLVVLHNPHAVRPISCEMFGGPYDENRSVVVRGSQATWETVAYGPLAHRVPGINVV